MPSLRAVQSRIAVTVWFTNNYTHAIAIKLCDNNEKISVFEILVFYSQSKKIQKDQLGIKCLILGRSKAKNGIHVEEIR